MTTNSQVPLTPYAVRTSDILGRYIVATKDFEAGQLIFEEDPLIVYSKFDTQESVRDSRLTTCITCYRVVNKSKAVMCKDCKWPFCSSSCAESDCHGSLECQLLTNNRIIPTPNAFRVLYLLRLTMLRESERRKWDGIMDMNSTFDIHYNDQEFNRKLCQESVETKEFLERYCNVNLSTVLIQRVNRIFSINSFRFKEPGLTKEDPGRNFCALYDVCSLIANSCAPNTDWHLQKREPFGAIGKIGIYARREILKGEMISISYIPDCIAQGTPQRKLTLLNECRFLCVCARCEDPSELGTFYSALECPECNHGFLLPPSSLYPADPAAESRFRCGQCSFMLEQRKVAEVEESYRQKMVAVMCETSGESRRKGFETLIVNASFLHKLHWNHNLVIATIQLWLLSLDFKVLLATTPRSNLMFHSIIRRTDQALTISHCFGSVAQQIKLEAYTANAMIRHHFRSVDYFKMNVDFTNPDDKFEVVKQIVEHLGNGIVMADLEHLDKTTVAIVLEMEEKILVWNARLSKCLEGFSKVI